MGDALQGGMSAWEVLVCKLDEAQLVVGHSLILALAQFGAWLIPLEVGE